MPQNLLKRLATMPNLKIGRKKSASLSAASTTDHVRLEVPAVVPRMMSGDLGGSDAELRAVAELENKELKQRNSELEQRISELEQQQNQQQQQQLPSPPRDPTEEWLESKGVFAEVTGVVSQLCGGESPADNPRPLLEVEKVQEALEKGLPQLAGKISDAASRVARAKSVAAAADWTPKTIKESATRALFETALTKQQAHAGSTDAFPGADHVFSVDGLPPWMWGVSKKQFQTFVNEVRAAHAAGKIKGQPDPNEDFYYDPAKFDNPNVGPNMHQVNLWMIKPMTKELKPLPGLSYALGKNLRTGGLRCDLFYSHAWDEGIYELAAHALAAWPDELAGDEHGAYICCLSNPQNLDITAVLKHPEGSPFVRVLGATPRPAHMIMLANRNTAIHSRLWCVLEAHVARQMEVPSRIEGPATQLIMGALGDDLKRLELEVETKTKEAEADAIEAFQQGLSLTSKEAKAEAQAKQEATQEQIVELKEQLAAEKLKVLLKPSSELIRLEKAKCSRDEDEAIIRPQIAASEDAITELIADLLRDNVCGVKRVRGEAVDGPLGRLPLDGSPVSLKARKPLCTSSGLLQLGEWLHSRPSSGVALDLSENPKAMGALLPVICRELKANVELSSIK